MKRYMKLTQQLKQIATTLLLIITLLIPIDLLAKDYVIISEVMYDSPLNEQIASGVAYSNGEYIELYNAGIDDVNLTNWSLKGGGSTEIYTFPANTILTPKSYLVVAYQYLNSGFTLDQLFDGFATGTGKQIQYQRKIILSNSGEALKLRDPDGTTKDSLYIDGTTNKTKPYRLSAENADGIAGNACVSIQRKTTTFDSNGNAILNNQEWTTATVNIYSQTAAFSAPTIPGVTNTSLSTGQNYIISVTPLDATGQIDIDNGQIALHNEARGLISILYFDGLGRPIETVQQGITPNRLDLVSYSQYDGVGRKWKQWLPITSTEKGAFVNLSTFESNQTTLYDGDSKPYSEIVYEPSPLNRINEQFGAGQDWKTNNKRVQTDYQTNENEVAYYFVNSANALERGTNYAANSLYKTIVSDEDNKTLTEYKDKLGRVIMKQSSTDAVQTYYVYNDLGQLSYVLPPAAADALSIGTYQDNNSILKQYGYLYKYDERGNCIEKRLPGCESIYMVYDRADRLIMSQDGNQRLSNKWTITKYDVLERVIFTGLASSISTSHTDLIATYKDELIVETYDSGTYANLKFPDAVPLTINFYDDYSFIPDGSNLEYDNTMEQSGYAPQWSSAKGLLTGTHTYILDGTESNYIASTLFYDYKGQVIQSRSSNYLGGYDVACNQYNFAGSITKTMKTHNVNGQASITEIYFFTYDNGNRLKTTTYKLNNSDAVVLASNTYDELGRLTGKQRHNNTDNETYAYNLRNWTTGITSGSFQENLYYTANPINSNPCYNGNISYSTWKYDNALKGYAYEYDDLNRLTNAISQQGTSNQPTGSFNENFSFDKMGNILTLQRKKDNVLIDDLTMHYANNEKSNQLLWADDNRGSQNQYTVKEYQNKSNTQNEFSYDANGNMTKDLDRDIVTIQYNILNLPDIVQFKTGDKIINTYSASGQKLKSEYYTYLLKTTLPLTVSEGEIINLPYTSNSFSYNGTAYIDNKEYSCNKVFVNQYGGYYSDSYIFNRLYNTEGYVTGSVIPDMNNYQSGIQYNYFRKDHLGNIREVWQAAYNKYSGPVAASTIQQTQYYPSGLPWAESVGQDVQSQKYNGKEFIEMHGLDEYDSFARMYYPAFVRTPTVDPLAEKYHNLSPYAWCDNNHVNVIDPDGMDYWSTNDPAEIERFMNSVRNGSAYYNASNWTHVSDKDFTANLTYNDETFKFYTSFSYYDKKGILTCEGVSFTNTMNFLNERELNPLEKWSNSDNFFANYAYNTLNDLFVTLQPLVEPFIGAIRVNELTGGKAFVNIDGTTNYNAIESASSTLSGIIQPTNVVKGLGTLSKLNASQFSKTFKGTLSRFNPSFRGFLNRRINKLIDSWNTSVPTGKIVVDGAEISSEINNK